MVQTEASPTFHGWDFKGGVLSQIHSPQERGGSAGGSPSVAQPPPTHPLAASLLTSTCLFLLSVSLPRALLSPVSCSGHFIVGFVHTLLLHLGVLQRRDGFTPGSLAPQEGTC